MKGLRNGTFVASLVCAILVSAGAAGRELTLEEKVRFSELVERADAAYRLGDYREADKSLGRAMDLDPDDRTVFDERVRVGPASFLKLLDAPLRRKTAQRFLKASLELEATLREDATYMGRLVADYAISRDERGRRLLRRIRIFGPHAVPYLLDYARHTSDANIRSAIALALLDIGPEAVSPLIEALRADENETLSTVIYVLGELKGHRALPPLASIALDASRPPFIRSSARGAMAKILGEEDLSVGPLHQYYFQVIERLFRTRALESRGVEPFAYLWRWSTEEGRLTKTRVPMELHLPELMIRTSLEAIEAEKSVEPFITYLLYATLEKQAICDRKVRWCRASGAESARYRSLTHILALPIEGGRLESAARILGANLADYLRQHEIAACEEAIDGARRLTQVASAAHFDWVVAAALDNGDPAVARLALKRLSERRLRQKPGEDSVLLRALDSDNEGVAFEAALALLRADPSLGFPRYWEAVGVLAKSLEAGPSERRAFLFVKGNLGKRLSRILRSVGFRVESAALDQLGTTLAEGSGSDLVIVDRADTDIMSRLILHKQSAAFDLFVVTDAEWQELETVFPEISGVVNSNLTGVLLARPFADLAEAHPAGDGNVDAYRAASALGEIDSSAFNKVSVLLAAPLKRVLRQRGSAVRGRAFRLVHKFGDATLQDTLIEIVSDDSEARGSRMLALDALAAIVSRGDVALSEEHFKGLLRLVREGDEQFSEETVKTLSSSPLTNDRRKILLDLLQE